MKSAVLKIKGKQYWVSEGETILIDGLSRNDDLNPQVMLVIDDDKVVVGKPYVGKASVITKVLEQFKGDKVYVLKYKAKSRYRRKIGFRPLLTKVEVSKISY